MIAWLRRRRAQMNHAPFSAAELNAWNWQRRIDSERAARDRAASRRWLPDRRTW